MIQKIDLVMWTKNGAPFLQRVLSRIDGVIPRNSICHKILVDDASKDATKKIAKDFGWEVFLNPKTGIAAAANFALSKVETDLFASFEQDVVLSKDWWDRIPSYMSDNRVACAQGIRISTDPLLAKLDQYKYIRAKSDDFVDIGGFGVSMDNNLFRTDLLKSLGGFPTECPRCSDTILRKRVIRSGLKWAIDKSVISDHIRSGLRDVYERERTLSQTCVHSKDCSEPLISTFHSLRLFLTSPIRGIVVAYTVRCFPLIWVYPKMRFYAMQARKANK